MNAGRKFLEWIVLGVCAFVLSKAILSLVLEPGDTPADGNPIWKLILALSYVGVAVLLTACYPKTIFALSRNWFLVALIALTLASFLWAETPGLVLQRSIAVLGTTLFGLAIAVLLSVEDQLRLMSWVFRMIAVLCLACVVLAPGYGIADAANSTGRGVEFLLTRISLDR